MIGLVVLLSSPLALAQQPTPTAPQLSAPSARWPVGLFPEHGKRTIGWPTSIPVLQKGRMVAGDITGDLLPDAVLLNGGFPVVAYGPALHSAVFELAEAANDIAILASTIPGQADELALVGPEGLVLLSGYDAGSFQRDLIGSSAWNDAVGLRAADTNGDGKPDLVGVSAQNEILFLENVRSPFPLETIVPIGEAVLDFAPIDWFGGGAERAVAVFTYSGLFVHTKAGGLPPLVISGATDGGFLAILRQAGLPYERIALVYEVSGVQWLLLADVQAPVGDPPLALGSVQVFGLTSGDANMDGDDDLYLVHRASHETALLLNRSADPDPGDFGFGPYYGELIDVAPNHSPSPTWSSSPVLADLSLDGDPDALVFVEASNQFVYVENVRRRLVVKQIVVEGGFYIFDENIDIGELRLKMRAPPKLPFIPTHIEITGWRQTNALGGNLGADAQAATHTFSVLGPGRKATSQILLAELDLSTPNIYHFDMRAVRMVNQMVVAAGPSTVHAFTTPALLTTSLEDVFGEGTTLRVILIEQDEQEEVELDDTELADRQLSPKAVRTGTIPLIEFPPDPF